MPREHLRGVTFRSRGLNKASAFLTARFSRLEFPLRPALLSATISLEASWGTEFSVFLEGLLQAWGEATRGTGNNVSETRVRGKGSRGGEDVALSTDHLFALGTGFGLSDVLLEMDGFFKIKAGVAKVKCDG